MEPEPYRWNARDYAKNSSGQFEWAQELIAKLDLQGYESVLDIGCGDGKITYRLAEAVKRGYVLGVDQSEEMIRIAIEQFPPAKYPNLSFLRMNAMDICVSHKFDVAFSNATLHWVKDQVAVLRGVRKCLKSGGKILFQMGGCGNAADVFVAIEKLLQHVPWRQYYEDFTPPYHFYTPEEYEAWLLETGFRPVRVDLLPKDMQHHGAERFKGWLRTTWFPYTERLPVELRDTFLSELVETYLMAHPVDANGNTHVKMVRLEVEAYTL
ncbi:MAG: class I SAM-dependent methyltransferase [Desulfomonilaceae bacterium]